MRNDVQPCTLILVYVILVYVMLAPSYLLAGTISCALTHVATREALGDPTAIARGPPYPSVVCNLLSPALNLCHVRPTPMRPTYRCLPLDTVPQLLRPLALLPSIHSVHVFFFHFLPTTFFS